MIPAVTPLLLVLGGLAALAAGGATLRSLGRGYRIGRLLATVPRVSVGEAVRIATARERRYVAIQGRIESDEAFEDAHQRPLVLRRTRIEVRTESRWRRIEDALESVPFEISEGLDAIAVDATALGDGLVVMPRESVGSVGDLADRAPAGVDPSAAARARIDLVSSIEHATVIGWPALAEDRRPVMTAGAGRPLVLSVLDTDEAMRVLAHGERLRPGLAAGFLIVGLALGAIGLAWAGAQAIGLLGPSVVLAAEASPPSTVAPVDSEPLPSAQAGDTRTSGEGPGLVGAPGLAIAGVLVLGVLAVAGTLVYVRLTGGPRRP
jgi:hypothetical protein